LAILFDIPIEVSTDIVSLLSLAIGVISFMDITNSIAGVIMGTRCGDIDVGLIPYVMSSTGKKFDEVMTDLN